MLAVVQLAGFFAMLGALVFLTWFAPAGEVDSWMQGVLGPLIGLQARGAYEATSFYYQSSAGSKAKDKP